MLLCVFIGEDMQRNYEKEKLLIEYVISSSDIFALCSGILKEDYFIVDLKNTVKMIRSHYNKYNALPSIEQIEVETGVRLKTHEMNRQKIEYCLVEIEKFCKIKAMQAAIMNAAEIAEKGSEEEFAKVSEEIRDVLTISLSKDLGIDFFNSDVIERIENRKKRDEKLPSGYRYFDHHLNGGPSRKDIIIFCGVSGGGKSLTLQNFSLKYANQGKTVLYISFELYQDMIDERFMTMVSGLNSQEQLYKKLDVSKEIEKNNKGGLYIKYLKVGSKIGDIRAFLKEFELKYGKLPDILAVDYLDLVSPDMPVSKENVSLKDKLASEELRALGIEYNFLILTASQLNRQSRDATTIGQQHIAGGITKIYTADIVVAVNINKKMGDCYMTFLKTRSSGGEGETVFLKYNNSNLRIIDTEPKNTALIPKNFLESLDFEVEKNNSNNFKDALGILIDDYD